MAATAHVSCPGQCCIYAGVAGANDPAFSGITKEIIRHLSTYIFFKPSNSQVTSHRSIFFLRINNVPVLQMDAGVI